MKPVIALVGQPNTGKSTLFNILTGSHQHVGNWPGKTVEQKKGAFSHNGNEFDIIDLPGSYSLSANSPEEEITREYLLKEKPDCVVVTVDASQIERTLFMLAEMCQLPFRIILAITMVDIARRQGEEIAAEKLLQMTGKDVVVLNAAKSLGVEELKQAVEKSLATPVTQSEEIEFHPLTKQLATELATLEYPLWSAGKLLEGDGTIRAEISSQLVEKEWQNIEGLLQTEQESAAETARQKHLWIQNLVENSVTRHSTEKKRRHRFDTLATHPLLGKVLAFSIILFAFILSFIVCIVAMKGLFPLIGLSSKWIPLNLGLCPQWLISFLADAFVPAVCMALMMFSFLVPLFFIIGTLEDVGYLARFSYVFDRMMNSMGLHGKSCMSFLMSFGCNMGGITGARTIDSWRQRMITSLLTSIVPCAAMWGVIGFVSILFFGKGAMAVIIALLLVMLVDLYFSSWLLRKFLPENTSLGLIMEMPPYHLPNFKTISRYSWGVIKGFIRRGGTLITGVFLLVWFLSYFPNGNVQTSWLAGLGRLLDPIGSLMGMDWKLMVALIASIASKEASLAVLAVLYGIGGQASSINSLMMQQGAISQNLGDALLADISPETALAFVFALFFSIPCIGTLGTLYAENKSLKWTLIGAGYYTLTSFVMGILAYQAGRLIF